MIFLEIMVAFPQIDGATRFQMLAIESGSHWRNEDTRSGVEKDFRRLGFEKPVVVGHRHRIDIARRAGDRELVRESVDRLPVFWGEERSAIYRQFIGREFANDPGGQTLLDEDVVIDNQLSPGDRVAEGLEEFIS